MSLSRRLWRLAHQSLRSAPQFLRSAPESLTGNSDERRARQAAERELEEFLGSSSFGATAPPPPPPHPMARQYATLQIPVGADLETVERTWRRLVLQHHPDRFAGDPAAERAANERLRRINQAHAELVAWLRGEGS